MLFLGLCFPLFSISPLSIDESFIIALAFLKTFQHSAAFTIYKDTTGFHLGAYW